MKIKAFHIRNYRSIVDSGICFLSNDNITALIGQNESGKTSVLEALRSFYEGRITDDVLRSDLTFPEITCVFDLESLNLEQAISFSGIPQEMHKILRQKKEIRLIRRWTHATKSIFMLSEPELLAFYEKSERLHDEADRMIRQSKEHFEQQIENIRIRQEESAKTVAQAKSEVNKLFVRIEELTKTLSKAKSPDIQITAQQEKESCQTKYEQAREHLRELLTAEEQEQTTYAGLASQLEHVRDYIAIGDRIKQIKIEILEKAALIAEAEHQYELCSSEKEARVISKRLEQLRNIHNQLSTDLKDHTDRLWMSGKTISKELSGKDPEIARDEALKEIEQEKNYRSPEELGRQLFPYLPVFEFFEDFSSLLPNKIDLEDLLNENRQAEGYKAARNFLRIAGLNADFFRERNHRILKQKIENLNSDITIDFQDYWRQQVGKNDKIRLNFELEHYDYTMPEKSGKPYLEFWIKDKMERLYPKQRSRGVRWFLSFYLELKATAKENHQNRILLIDEPGLSLHARAQEDVLKVFEDLRSELQIIYCTHSPHLIDLHKLYRIMAVQRSRTDDETSETVIYDSRALSTASADTLSPIYSLMGTRLNDRQFIYPRNNVLVADIVTFYYLDCLTRIFADDLEIHFIPAQGEEAISMMANLLFGWKIDFGFVAFDNEKNRQAADWLSNTLFAAQPDESNRLIVELIGIQAVEDLFSTLDFKKYILKQRIGITERNSTFIAQHNISRNLLATGFCSTVEQENLKIPDFDEETQENCRLLFDNLRKMMNNPNL